MKKTVLLLIALLAICIIAPGTAAPADTLTLPADLTAVGEQAFFGDGSLERIGTHAFEHSGIVSLDIPAAVTQIGEYAFHCCDSLTAITISPDNPVYAFRDGFLFNEPEHAIVFLLPSAAGAVRVPEGVTAIAGSAFADCAGLTELSLPEGLAEIGEFAFFQCTSLTKVRLPSTVTSVGEGAFKGCTALTVLTVPAGLTEIGEEAVRDCTSLAAVSFSGCENIETLPARVFFNCQSLRDVTLPPHLMDLQTSVFSGCESLEEIYIPEGTHSIGLQCFFNCTSLARVHIPASVQRIGFFAFDTISSPLLTFYAPAGSTAAQWAVSEGIPVVTE